MNKQLPSKARPDNPRANINIFIWFRFFTYRVYKTCSAAKHAALKQENACRSMLGNMPCRALPEKATRNASLFVPMKCTKSVLGLCCLLKRKLSFFNIVNVNSSKDQVCIGFMRMCTLKLS